ncbi:uncharacterized protein LOC141680659 [Apium graveolens]|uniref:uncharacterized protein LOC141680659 n=1 Tax=Apium graveolens TaxID=4045 RepID=UPI003D7B9C08
MAESPSYLNAATGNNSSSTTQAQIIDASHSYYLHPSDHPGLILVIITLNEQNYNQWFRSMRIALSSKLKLSFVDGLYVKPTNATLLLHWNRCNDIVISWILNIVSPDIRQRVMYMTVAKDIWDDFAIRFAQTNVPKLFNLRKEIASLHQGNILIFAYFTKFRTLNDELDAFSVVPHCDCRKCTCGVNEKLDVLSKSTRLSQFLMGLSDQYTAIRGHLLLMTHVPSLSVAYSLLLQEENQRDISSTSVVSTDYVALSVRNQENQGGNMTYYSTNRHWKVNTGKRTVTNSSVICEVCHMSGHNKDKCFCVHEYPACHRLFGKPKPKPKLQTKIAYAHNVIAESGDQNSTFKSTEPTGFTSALCQQLMAMIQSDFKALSTAHNGNSSQSPK